MVPLLPRVYFQYVETGPKKKMAIFFQGNFCRFDSAKKTLR